MKKRYGYSLAEAMVALSIIGFIALLAMPIIISKMQDASNISKLQKVYKSLTDAVGSWMVDDRISEIRKTSYISAYPERFMPKYLRTTQESNTSTDGLLGKVYTDRNSHQFRIDFQDKYDCALLQNGSTLCLTPYNDDKYITRFGNSDVERIINHTSNVKHYDNAVSSIVKDERICTPQCVQVNGWTTHCDYSEGCKTHAYRDIADYEYCSLVNAVNERLGGLYTPDDFIRQLQNNLANKSIEEFNKDLLKYSQPQDKDGTDSGLDYDAGVIFSDAFLYEMLNTAKNDEDMRRLLTKNSAFNKLYDRYERDGLEKFGLTCSGDAVYFDFSLAACNSEELYVIFQSPEFEEFYIKRNNKLNEIVKNDPKYLGSNNYLIFTDSCKKSGHFSGTGMMYESTAAFFGNFDDRYPMFNFDTYTYKLVPSPKNYVTEENVVWNETIEREPIYVAPSESGKVNIAQEQVHAHSSDKPVMEVVVDTNGASAPNKLGTDLFIFYIYPDGHVGVRSQDTSTNNCYMNQYYQCFKAVFNNDWKKPY